MFYAGFKMFMETNFSGIRLVQPLCTCRPTQSTTDSCHFYCNLNLFPVYKFDGTVSTGGVQSGGIDGLCNSTKLPKSIIQVMYCKRGRNNVPTMHVMEIFAHFYVCSLHCLWAFCLCFGLSFLHLTSFTYLGVLSL